MKQVITEVREEVVIKRYERPMIEGARSGNFVNGGANGCGCGAGTNPKVERQKNPQKIRE